MPSSLLAHLSMALEQGQREEFLARLRDLNAGLEDPAARANFLAAFKDTPRLEEQLIQLCLLIDNSPEFDRVAEMLEQVARDGIDPEHPAETRLRALGALGHLRRMDDDSFSKVSELARSEGDLAIQYGAIGTLALWLNEPASWGEKIIQNLGGIVQTSPRRELQSDSLRILIAHQPDLPNELRGLINDYLAGQPSVEDRLMVGLTVGTFSRGEDARNFALTHLEEAYRQGNSLEQKRYILSEMVHFGQSDVAELIRQLPTDNPLLAQDVNDYQEIFALGAATISEIERQKAERDHRRGTPLFAKKEEAAH